MQENDRSGLPEKQCRAALFDRVPAGTEKEETQMLQKIRNVEIVASENREGLYA